ncbi:hypothetical protein [Alkaliphilus sp. B6464]|uniref:hypothetical protein n=1 Tax=Alkaliphilus sp. B6464 TaxID=2731219 RepID=UPI001BAA0799|nr:hypothetical protein [Alkaliphilus sp. B6464]QUH20226.1 hypothetical protein HYG84_10105 [Alkaliphilus sp. B6464]
MNKKLLGILLCILLVLTACQSKIPDGVSEEFYKEVKGLVVHLVENIDEYKSGKPHSLMSTPEYKKVLEMQNNYENYNGAEQDIIDYLWLLYDSVNFYYSDSSSFDIDDIIEIGTKLSELMNFKIDVPKLIK